MISALVVVAAAVLLQQPACDALETISLPRVTIDAAEFVNAAAPALGRGGRGGAGTPLPAHCRVGATLTPSPDSGHSRYAP